ncbi:hypothetical protein T484DRAFT_1843813 [Baffinella frigidus]|nr:hypothetical protein T484DRAFT_1843813 [Cryptophyta sp. CCMP2293]
MTSTGAKRCVQLSSQEDRRVRGENRKMPLAGFTSGRLRSKTENRPEDRFPPATPGRGAVRKEWALSCKQAGSGAPATRCCRGRGEAAEEDCSGGAGRRDRYAGLGGAAPREYCGAGCKKCRGQGHQWLRAWGKEQRAGANVPSAGVPALVDDYLDDESENEDAMSEDISPGGERAGDSAEEGLEEDEEAAASSHQAAHPPGSRSHVGASTSSPAARRSPGRSPGSKVDGASVSAQGSTLRSSDDEVNQVRPSSST